MYLLNFSQSSAAASIRGGADEADSWMVHSRSEYILSIFIQWTRAYERANIKHSLCFVIFVRGEMPKFAQQQKFE